MSFVLRARAVSSRLATPAFSSSVARFSTTSRSLKGPVETVKETAKKVDRTVADAAVKGIETGRTFAQSPFSHSSVTVCPGELPTPE